MKRINFKSFLVYTLDKVPVETSIVIKINSYGNFLKFE